MNTGAKLLAFSVALLVGVFATAYRHNGAAIDGYLHTSLLHVQGHLHVQDWLLMIFGSLCVGGVAVGVLRRPDSFDWRWSVWLLIGGITLYAEFANVPWLKEASCRILDGHHHGAWTEPCYLPG